MNNIFFTSDTHFCHKNIINFCNRPFGSVEEMNEKLIENWNKVVTNRDIIYHLGDFCFGGSAEWHTILGRLNGRITLIKGNHDYKNLRAGYDRLFENVTDKMLIKIGNRQIYLNHEPFLCYGGTYRNKQDLVYQFFGHIHSGPRCTSGKDYDRYSSMLFPFQYDVGVDNNEFIPVSFEEIDAIIQSKL